MLDSEIIGIIKNGFSINDVCLKIYGYTNGSSMKKLKAFIDENKIDISHFEKKNKNKKYEMDTRKCPVCDTYFEVRENLKKMTCSFSCANKHFRSVKSEEEKKKISETLKSKKKISETLKSKNKKNEKESYRNNKSERENLKDCACGNKFEIKVTEKGRKSKSKYCSKTCSNYYAILKFKDIIKDRIKNGKHKGWQSRKIESYPEKFFKIVLGNNKIKYEFNKPIKKSDLGIDCSSNYFLDFYLPEKNIDLEIDGKQHEYEDRKEMDIRRDEYVSKFFYVYRIKWKNINNEKGKKYISEEIEKFLNFYNSIESVNLKLVSNNI